MIFTFQQSANLFSLFFFYSRQSNIILSRFEQTTWRQFQWYNKTQIVCVFGMSLLWRSKQTESFILNYFSLSNGKEKTIHYWMAIPSSVHFFFFSSLIASYVRPSFIRMWCVHTIRIRIYDVVGGIRWSRTCCWTMKMLLSGRRMAYIIIPATQKYVVFFFNLQQNVLTMMVQYLKLRLLASEPTRVFEREKQQINGEGKGAKKWLVPDYCS